MWSCHGNDYAPFAGVLCLLNKVGIRERGIRCYFLVPCPRRPIMKQMPAGATFPSSPGCRQRQWLDTQHRQLSLGSVCLSRSQRNLDKRLRRIGGPLPYLYLKIKQNKTKKNKKFKKAVTGSMVGELGT